METLTVNSAIKKLEKLRREEPKAPNYIARINLPDYKISDKSPLPVRAYFHGGHG